MALDPRYITGFTLEQYFVDKDTGAPLAGGVLSFWEDDARTTPKLVYELSGAPPNYTYTPLPNPIILSSVGTIQDAAGNNIALYAYPFDANGNLQLYYVTCDSSFGTEQFTREAWPFNEANGVSPSPGGAVSVYNANQIKNPQFAAVLFIAPGPDVITIGGAGSFTFNIAPEWVLNVTATGATTVSVTRTSITGIAAYPGNPPYTLTVTPGLNITALSLVQNIANDPDIWSPQTITSLNGWLNGSILLAPGSEVTMLYAPSQGPSQLILAQNNMTGVYTQFNRTIQLAPATNTDNSDVGFVNIVLQLSTSNPTTFSNVQIVSLESNIPNIAYYQTTVNMQQAALSFYYFNQVIARGFPSWLIGWDFPLNPAQFLGDTGVGPFATGANTSSYYWDQTIIFQSANNAIQVSRYLDGSLVAVAQTDTKLALIQYMDLPTASDMIDDYISCNVNATTNQVGGIPCTIQLFYTTGTLPNLNANNSIVATLNADGSVATFHNGSQPWVEIPRSNLGNASFTISLTSTRQNYGFSNWLTTQAAADSAKFVAVVVGFGTLRNTQSITIGSISAIPGQIPGVPAPQSPTVVLLECSRYYTKSFPSNVIPAQNTKVNADAVWFPATVAAGNAGISQQVELPTSMANLIPVYTFYNPQAANAFVWNYNTMASFTTTALQQAGNKSFAINFFSDAGCAIGNVLGFHYTADARLGLV